MSNWHWEEQSSLFDPAAAREARDEAMARVDGHAPDDWKGVADAGIEYLARSRAEFTTDDVWQYLAERDVPMPPEPRALGPRMLAAARRSVVFRTDRVVTCKRPERHGAPIRVWLSGIYRDWGD